MAGYEEMVNQRKPVLRYVIGAGLLILLGVLIWLAVAAVRNDSKPKPTSNSGTSSQNESPASSGQSAAPSGTSQSAGSSAAHNPSGQPGQAASGPSSTPPSSSAATGSSSQPQLADTGPGETLALFAAATFIGWLIHYRRTKRNATSR